MSRQFKIQPLDMTFVLPDKNKRVYIVGIDTYLGIHFAKYLIEEGYDVHGCGNQNLNCDPIKQVARLDIVWHAAQSH